MTAMLAMLLRLRGRPDHSSAHAARESRLEAIRDAVDEFSYAIAMLIAGHDPPPGAANDELMARMRSAVRPFLERGDVMRPDFGAFGDLRVEGDLLAAAEPVLAILEFEDCCVRETPAGRLVPSRRRHLRLTMRLTIDPASVVDCVVSETGTIGA